MMVVLAGDEANLTQVLARPPSSFLLE